MKFEPHEHLELPHGNSILWRYMALGKFLDLLVHSRLFFADARRLTDKNEAVMPERTIAAKKKQLEEKGFVNQELNDKLDEFRCDHNPMRLRPSISCWSKGRHESYALWKIYLSGSTDGVAIRTTFSKLKQSMNHRSDLTIYAAKVQYRDYLKETELSKHRLIATKRSPYEYEKEVRLFTTLNDPQDTTSPKDLDRNWDTFIQVDLEHLAQQIFVSPFANSGLYGILKEIIGKHQPTLVEKLKPSVIRDQ